MPLFSLAEDLTAHVFSFTFCTIRVNQQENNGILERRKGICHMEAYAVVQTGGKQYRVKAGNTLRVERLDVEAGKKVELRPVLAVSDGKKLQVGTPEIKNAKVISTVIEHVRGDKVVSFKRKRRKGYSKKKGHRQNLTVLKVESIDQENG